jgi:hypothetical protein
MLSFIVQACWGKPSDVYMQLPAYLEKRRLLAEQRRAEEAKVFMAHVLAGGDIADLFD